MDARNKALHKSAAASMAGKKEAAVIKDPNLRHVASLLQQVLYT